MRSLLTTTLILLAAPALAEPRTLTAEVWADNWFAMHVNGALVAEDSVPITTERSFNAETVSFTADGPMTIAIKAMDFKENDSGLEYIGSRRQQMGDGGLIAQFRDAETGETLAVTNAAARCLVVHRAPIDRACEAERDPVAGLGACGFEIAEEPAGWTSPGFDDSAWPAATEHSARAVDPKGGYDRIDWDESARLIWGADLELDNTVLCRITVN
ncbi:MAG: PEBP family protein [Pseudomonadota bacterium]